MRTDYQHALSTHRERSVTRRNGGASLQHGAGAQRSRTGAVALGLPLGLAGAISALLIAAPAGGLHALSAPAVVAGASDIHALSALSSEATEALDVVAVSGLEAIASEAPALETAASAVSPASPAPAASPAVTKTVSMVDNRNLPLRLTVTPGTTVRWINDGAVPHTASTQDGMIESGFLKSGQSYAFTFDTPGEYVYFCRPHVFLGMTGGVVVQ